MATPDLGAQVVKLCGERVIPRNPIANAFTKQVTAKRVAAEWLAAAQCCHPRDPKANGPT